MNLANASKKLTILILSYNTKEITRRCLQTIQKTMRGEWQVLVVDNNSPDDSVNMIRGEFPFVRVIESKENKGFAGGNNIGLKTVDTEYVMLLNSDTEFLPNQPWDDVFQYLDRNKEVGVLSPKVMLPNGKLDMACHRGFPTPWNAFCYFLKLEKIFGSVPVINRLFSGYHQLWKNFTTIHDIDACIGAGMIVRTSAMKEVGLLDESFFMYGEDLDWCYRFKERGWRVIFYPLLSIVHLKYQSGIQKEKAGRKHTTSTTASFFDTMMQFYDKHYEKRYPSWVRGIIRVGINIIRYMKGVPYGSHK